MWSSRQRRRDSERPRLSAGNAPQRSPSPRYTQTARGLELDSSRGAEIPPAGAGDQSGDSTLQPCAGTRHQGYVTNARALERVAPVAARGRRFPARRCARPRPRASPPRPPRPRRAGPRFPTLPEPAGQAAEGPGVAASVRSVTASPGRHGPARTPARGSRFSLSLSPVPAGPGSAFAQSRFRTRPAARAASSPLATRLTGLAPLGPRSAQYPGRTARSPHTQPLRRGKDRGQGGDPNADRAAGLGLLARVPASGADSAGIFKLSLLGLSQREKTETTPGRKIHLRTAGSLRLLGADRRKTTSPIGLCALGVV